MFGGGFVLPVKVEAVFAASVVSSTRRAQRFWHMNYKAVFAAFFVPLLSMFDLLIQNFR